MSMNDLIVVLAEVVLATTSSDITCARHCRTGGVAMKPAPAR